MDVQTLKRWARIEEVEERQMESIERLRSAMTKVTPVMSETGTSGAGYADSSKIPGQIAKLLELQEKYKDTILECETIKAEVERWLAGLLPIEQQIIRCRYQYHMSWTKVAIHVNYSRAQVFNIHRSALQKEINIIEQ